MATVRDGKIVHVYPELFGRQLSEEETQRALVLLNDVFKIGSRKVLTPHGDLFAFYVKPFVRIITKSNDYLTIDGETGITCRKEEIDLQRLVYEFYRSVCDTYMRDIDNTSDPVTRDEDANLRRKIKILYHTVGNGTFQKNVIKDARYHLRSKLEKPRRLSSVYFMFQENDSTRCKIGYSLDMLQRTEQLQPGNPAILRVHRTIRVDNYDSDLVETFFHIRYGNRNTLNEWYHLSIEEVDQIDENEVSESLKKLILA